MAATRALAGLRVIEMAGLAPAPFAGMVLADFGAEVVRVDRPGIKNIDLLSRGKRSVALDIKAPGGADTLKALCRKADVILEPFRPGAMEKLGLGPAVLQAENPGLIYARLTGFGQTGKYARLAGHDINYMASSGVLSLLGEKGKKPAPPANLLGDFAAGSLTCLLGIQMALLERSRSGQGQVVDANMVDGLAYLASFVHTFSHIGLWDTEKRGENLLDGGAPFYDTYETADGRFMSVGAIEPHFFRNLLRGLDLDPAAVPSQNDLSDWPRMRTEFERAFRERSMKEWTEVFDNLDACVTPVVGLTETDKHPRPFLVRGPEGDLQPRPAPHLSRSSYFAKPDRRPIEGEHTRAVLKELASFSDAEVDALIERGVVVDGSVHRDGWNRNSFGQEVDKDSRC